MSFPTPKGDAPEGQLMREPRVCLGPAWALSYYKFFLTGTSTAVAPFQNGTLTTPFGSNQITSDAFGRFPAIYLDSSVTYKVQFFNAANVLQWTVDPYATTLSTAGFSTNTTYGIQIAPTGEVTIPAPNSGGTGITLTLKAGAIGTAAIKVSATLPGQPAIIINTSATTGAQTATFAATNKPGPNITYTVTATVAPSGATYTGGTLTSAWPGITNSTFSIMLSTGQVITGATFTNGSTTFTTPSTAIAGTPTTTLQVTGPQASSPAGWLPIQCDGVLYYTPIWFDNNFVRYTPSPGPIGEAINAATVTFNSNGTTTVTGGTAIPSNWFTPTSAGAGASYYINITKTSGNAGLAFSAAQGSWVNINGGLTINSNGSAPLGGTYQLSSSVTGTPVVANGTITLSGGNGVQQQAYNVNFIVFNTNGTVTSGGGTTPGNWYLPTTVGIGSSYFMNVTVTAGGSVGGLVDGVYTAMGSTALNLWPVAGAAQATNYGAAGTISISNTSDNTGVLASSAFQIGNFTGGGVAFTDLTGHATRSFNTNGTTTGGAAYNWYNPTTTGIGSSYWINITATGPGTLTGITQGVWTSLATQLNLGCSGVTSKVCTYQLSTSSSGSPVVAQGSFPVQNIS